MKCEFCGGDTGDEIEMCDKCFDEFREKFAPILNAISDAAENDPEALEKWTEEIISKTPVDNSGEI